MNIRDLILGNKKIPQETVELKDLNCTVVVRGMSGYARDIYETELTKVFDREGRIVGSLTPAKMRSLVLCVFDAEGNQVFTEADIPALSAQPALYLSKIWDTITKLSGITEEKDPKKEGSQ